jgi:pyridoxamine 5'-phosphate oxidase-like protein
MDRAELVAFVRRRGVAVVATRGRSGTAQGAPVGIAITDEAEIIFDTSVHARRYHDIVAFPQVGIEVRGDDVTVQSEGAADVLTGADRDRCLRAYFQQYPERRERAHDPDVAYIRVRLRRLRLSDFHADSYGVQEIELDH